MKFLTTSRATWNKRLQVFFIVCLAWIISPLTQINNQGHHFWPGYLPGHMLSDIAWLFPPFVILLALRFLQRRRAVKTLSDAPVWIAPLWLVGWLLAGVLLLIFLDFLAWRFDDLFYFEVIQYYIYPVLFDDGLFSFGFVFLWGFLPPLLILLSLPVWWRRPPGAHLRARRICAGIGTVLLLFAWIAMTRSLLIEKASGDLFSYGYRAMWCAVPLVLAARAGWQAIVPFSVLLMFLFPFVSYFHVVPEIWKFYPAVDQAETEEDDRLADKNPPFDPAFTKSLTIADDPKPVYVNESAAIIELDAARVTKDEEDPTARIYPTFRDAVRAARRLDTELLPSVEMVDEYAKDLDDRLLAALELHLHHGSSIFPGGKQGFLAAMLARLPEQPEDDACTEAAAFLAAAIELGGDAPDIPDALRPRTRAFVERFDNNPDLATPIGFYTESKDLKAIFRRDRFLQRPFSDRHGNADGFFAGTSLSPVICLARILEADPELHRAYIGFRRLSERMGNPAANLNLDDLLEFRELFDDPPALARALHASEAFRRALDLGNETQIGIAFWPFMISKEARLFAKLYRSDDLPTTGVMDDFIAAIRTGKVDLAPTPVSGWYDHQLFALETMLLPERAQEASKLLLRREYKKILRRGFAALLTKQRETHVRELFTPVTAGLVGDAETAHPSLSVQPSATTYLRMARAYRFLEAELQTALGRDDLATIRLAGKPGNLDCELRDAAALFYGLYLVVCNDLILAPDFAPGEIEGLAPDPVETERREMSRDFQFANLQRVDNSTIQSWYTLWTQAGKWLQEAPKAKFLAEDRRVIIPVLGNASRTEYRYWTILGVRLSKIKVSYAHPPRLAGTPEQLDNQNVALWHPLYWVEKEYLLPVNVFEEVTLGSRPLTRKEFQALCDQGETREQILAALTSGSKPHHTAWIVLGGVILSVIILAMVVLRRRHRLHAGG